MKLTKSVCLSLDTQHIIEQVMRRYTKNYSVAIELIINQWLRFQQERKKMAEAIQIETKKEEVEQVTKAKVLKE